MQSGTGMEVRHEFDGVYCHQQYVDRFGQTTIFRSIAVRGMTSREGTKQHGPGAKTASLRPSAKRVVRGHVVTAD